ncbi:MAG: hypothetical protein H0T46_14480 [Deltaproteobacteria bacterium]|nr:hypothetical protein [Deltaproteobacteria bacterium]
MPSDISAPEVDASASPTAIRLGGRFTLFVSAVCDPGVEANLREPFELGPSFEIKRKDSKDTPRADGKKIREWQVEVLAWDLGDLVIPGITVTYTVQGKVGQVQTNAVRLRVDGVLGDVVDDPKALRGAHPPTALISRDWFWLWVGAGIGALLGAIGAYAWVSSLKRRKRTVRLTGGIMAIPRKKIDMTAEKALAALQKIKDSGVLDREADRKRGYTEMVDVVRDYIGARYQVASRDLTSLELIRNLKAVAPDDERAMVEVWLERCDRVKYGAYRASAAQANTVLDDARGLIVATTQLRDAAKADAA